MKDYQAEYDADLQTIADAKANGFMDCSGDHATVSAGTSLKA